MLWYGVGGLHGSVLNCTIIEANIMIHAIVIMVYIKTIMIDVKYIMIHIEFL